MNPRSALSWLGLGISCYRLGEKQLQVLTAAGPDADAALYKNREDADRYLLCAESALRMANIYDPTNSDVWGFTILLSLKDQRKMKQASDLLKYLLSLEIENLEMLYEVDIHNNNRLVRPC